MGVIDTIVGGGLGMATAGWNDRRQLEQAKKLQKEQIKGAKELGKFHQELAMKTWDETNYAAQRKQLEKAGLNVGLMYEGGGAGGTTSGGGMAMPSGQVAAGMPGGQMVGMGMQLGLQQAMQQATIDLTKAQTGKVEAEAAKIAGVDTAQGKATIDKLKADTENAMMNTAIGVYEKEIARIEAQVAGKTQDEIVREIKAANDQLEAQARSAGAQANVDEATQAAKIHQINTASQEQALRIQAQKAGLIKTEADTEAVKASIANMVQQMGLNNEQNAREWQKMDVQQKELSVKQFLAKNEQAKTQFNTSTPAQIRQWTEIIGGVISSAKVIGN